MPAFRLNCLTDADPNATFLDAGLEVWSRLEPAVRHDAFCRDHRGAGIAPRPLHQGDASDFGLVLPPN